jgi:hypothetical protein
MEKIELLYFEDCPSYKQALANLEAVVEEEYASLNVELINVDSSEKAQAMGFHGSPSIRVDGVDLERKSEGYSYNCRLYNIGGNLTGIPTKEYIRERISALEGKI